MKPNLQHAIECVERPGGSHEGVGRKKGKVTETFHSFLAAGDWERELVSLGLSGDHWVKSMGPVSTSIRGVRYYAVHSRWK